MRNILIMAAVALLMTSPAVAANDDPAQALGDWGLLGSWSRDCADTSGDASITTYAARSDGKVVLTYNMGPEISPNVYIVNSVRIVSPSQVVMQETYESDGRPFEVTLHKEGDRIRVMQSRNPETGQVFVRDGVITANGREGNWETRCPGS